MKVSGVIITYNEEKNIERCLRSLLNVVDEIVVVDSYSNDQTETICKRFDLRFIQHPFEGHIEQKNFAVQAATNDIVLSIDADECLSEELQVSIKEIKKAGEVKACSMNRLTSYCGQWIRHSGWYPDTKVRLWNREKGQWGGENPHDRVILKEGVSITHLKGDILHYSFPTIRSHVKTANKFSEIAAYEAVKKGKKVYIVYHIMLNPIWTFLHRYFIKMGILDGFRGFVISVLSATSNFLKYSKIWFLNQTK